MTSGRPMGRLERLALMVALCAHGLAHPAAAGDVKGTSTPPRLVDRPHATTTTTPSATGATVCLATSGTLCALANGTIYDAATNLMWERKDTPVGSGEDAGNLHDVDNRYSWAGTCRVTGTLCQPSAAAEAACKAQTDAAAWGQGCERCGQDAGTCDPDPFDFGAITTVWEWLSQVNAARHAGHGDWRLPSESGCNACWTGSPAFQCRACPAHELETILLAPYPCGRTPCIDGLFGPTAAFSYWSASTDATFPGNAWCVNSFFSGLVNAVNKDFDGFVRAVRSGS